MKTKLDEEKHANMEQLRLLQCRPEKIFLSGKHGIWSRALWAPSYSLSMTPNDFHPKIKTL